jgi:hypothetical protein
MHLIIFHTCQFNMKAYPFISNQSTNATTGGVADTGTNPTAAVGKTGKVGGTGISTSIGKGGNAGTLASGPAKREGTNYGSASGSSGGGGSASGTTNLTYHTFDLFEGNEELTSIQYLFTSLQTIENAGTFMNNAFAGCSKLNRISMFSSTVDLPLKATKTVSGVTTTDTQEWGANTMNGASSSSKNLDLQISASSKALDVKTDSMGLVAANVSAIKVSNLYSIYKNAEQAPKWNNVREKIVA